MKNFKLISLTLSTLTSSILASSPLLLRAEDVLIRPYISLPHLVERDTPLENNTAPININGTQNLALWDNTTNTACRTVLSGLQQSSNPSGTCICYNLPSLDSEKGSFEADLRLFKISESRGEWAGISPENIMVGLKYNGATVSEVKPGSGTNSSSGLSKRQDGGPQLLQTYMFVGQIDSAKMQGDMTM